jgi:hypothetical protein
MVGGREKGRCCPNGVGAPEIRILVLKNRSDAPGANLQSRYLNAGSPAHLHGAIRPGTSQE